MENQTFDQILQERTAKMKTVLGLKAKEYARGDRLHNFKRAGRILSVTPERALIGFFMKHMVSIMDLVDDIDEKPTLDVQQWNEKVGDAINYLVLLEALVLERAGK